MMQIINRRFFLLVCFAILVSSCNEKKQVKLKHLFTTSIADNGHKGEFNTKIGVSDSVFHIEETIMAHSAGYLPLYTTNYLWVNGKEIVNTLKFSEAQKKYNTKTIPFDSILENDVISNKKFIIKNRVLSDQQNEKGRESFVEIKSKCYAQLVDTAEDSLHIKIYYNDIVNQFSIKSYSEMDASFIKGFDITGDGIKELFVLSPGLSYWGRSWKVQVYELSF